MGQNFKNIGSKTAALCSG